MGSFMISFPAFPARLAPGRKVKAAAVAIAAGILLTACIPWEVARPDGPAPLRYRDQVFSKYTVAKDLQYGSGPGLDGAPVALKLDLYEPANDRIAARPAIVWVHGGFGHVVGSAGVGTQELVRVRTSNGRQRPLNR